MNSDVYINSTVLNIGEKAFIALSVVTPKDNEHESTLRVGYFNLLRDYYE